MVLCSTCFSELHIESSDCPPRYSLANNLWIGTLPHELSQLTLPEQLLIAQLYPRVYVFKLYPKKSYPHDPETLQRGMKGNVVTFEQNSQDIMRMVIGHMMPRPPKILASLISVTFVGVGKLPEDWIRRTFTVRREVVLTSLRWLVSNNPLYANVTLDENVIAGLPVDGVPEEITDILRQSHDSQATNAETPSYVPDEDLAEEEGSHLNPEGQFDLFIYLTFVL